MILTTRTLSLFFALCSLGSAAMAEPVIFRAEYVAEYGGLPVRAKGLRELVRLEENRYQLVSSAKSVLASVTETTEFELTDDELSPLHYAYLRVGLGKNKDESSRFNWSTNLLEHAGTNSTLEPGTLDKLSYQYKLRLDVARHLSLGNKDAILEYQIADEEKRKVYQFRILGEETLQTPVGELNTVRIERIRADKDRQTSLWLALDHDFLLVKLIQIENDRSFELNLDNAVMNGVTI